MTVNSEKIRRRICFTVECEDVAEFVKIYLSVDDMWVEQVKSMCWCDSDKCCGKCNS